MPKDKAINPALTKWDGPLGLPRFEAIGDEDYAPAFEAAMDAHDREIDAIASSTEAPTFDSVITPLELAGKALGHVLEGVHECAHGAAHGGLCGRHVVRQHRPQGGRLAPAQPGLFAGPRRARPAAILR